MNEITTQTRTSELALQAMNRGEIAVLSPPRLPWHPSIGEKFGVDRVAWKALVEAIYPNATSTDSVALALAYCQTRKLDIMKKMVHIVPMWRKKRKLPNGQWEQGRMVDTVWPSIAELRVTAFRTGQYAGKDEIEFGPEESRTFKFETENTDDQGEVATKVQEITIKFPMWGRITVHRLIGNGLIGKFVGPKLRWIEEYGRLRNTDMPNDMWAKRPYDQFEKVVEAAALRCAFPEELGNEYSSDEMDGKVIDVAPAETRQPREETPQQQTVQDTAPLQPRQQPQEHMPPEPGNPGRGYSEQEVMPPEPSEPARGPSQAFRASEAGNGFRDQPMEEMPPEPGENKPASDAQWLHDVDAACRAIFNDPTRTWQDLDAYQRNHVVPQRNSRPPETHKTATNIVKRWLDDMEKRAKAAAP
jgi:phage recombination protein Bet